MHLPSHRCDMRLPSLIDLVFLEAVRSLVLAMSRRKNVVYIILIGNHQKRDKLGKLGVAGSTIMKSS
jgi:hypothetical protein